MPRSSRRTKTYRRRRTYKPRGQFRKYRRYGRRLRRNYGSKRVMRIPTQMQQTCLKKFKWINETVKQLLIPISNVGTIRQINLNSLWKCDNASVNPESIPRLQELCQLYLFCKVYACKVTARFYISDKSQTGANVTAPLKCFIAAIPYGQSLPGLSAVPNAQDFERYVEGNPYYCKRAIVSSDSNSPGMVTLTKYYKISSLVGNKLEFNASNIYNQPIPSTASTLTAGPTNLIGCAVGAMIANQQTSATSNIYIGCDISCIYYTKFWGNKYQVE